MGGLCVLSLFDGISCGRLALQQLGISDPEYYACEIDVDAIAVTQHHFPDTIQLGDVRNVIETFSRAYRDRHGDDATVCVDLLLCGSPCQGFSQAAHNAGLDDARSALIEYFFAALRVLKPRFFLLENVRSSDAIMAYISEQCGCAARDVDSAWYSAQSRKRAYWTNLPGVDAEMTRAQEHATDAVLADVVGVDIPRELRSHRPLQVGVCSRNGNDAQNARIYSVCGKSTTICVRSDIKIAFKIDHRDRHYLTRMYKQENITWKRLVMEEYEVLQGIPRGYTYIHTGMNKVRRRKLVGNAWTVNVIASMLRDFTQFF